MNKVKDNSDKVKILLFSSLYPNAMQPRHGVFVEQRLRHLLASGEVEAKVVAPVPWFPVKNARVGGRYADFAGVPAQEERHGIEVFHPRYPVIPKVGMSLAPYLLSRAMAPILRRLRASYQFDLIDAHYFYPDGVAAVRLGRQLRLPVVVTGRGTDLNLIPRYRFPRRLITKAAREASAVITVSASLKKDLVRLGVEPDTITVLRNGVDLNQFVPLDRRLVRDELGLGGTVLLSVGHLIERKGHDRVLDALARLPDATLVIAGSGRLEKRSRQHAARVGVSERVRFIGAVTQGELVRYYNAADALVLASSREGMPNVVLESLACGTPVVASNVDGTPEVITAPEAGRIVTRRDGESIAVAVKAIMEEYPDRGSTRRHAEGLGWKSTSAGQLTLFRRLLGDESAPAEAPVDPATGEASGP